MKVQVHSRTLSFCSALKRPREHDGLGSGSEREKRKELFNVKLNHFQTWWDRKTPTGCVEQDGGWLARQTAQMEDTALVSEPRGFPLRSQRSHSAACALSETDRTEGHIQLLQDMLYI